MISSSRGFHEIRGSFEPAHAGSKWSSAQRDAASGSVSKVNSRELDLGLREDDSGFHEVVTRDQPHHNDGGFPTITDTPHRQTNNDGVMHKPTPQPRGSHKKHVQESMNTLDPARPSGMNKERARKREKAHGGHTNKHSRRSKSDDRNERSPNFDAGVDSVDGAYDIPAPIRKYTTTNPSTMSPIYHLFYDLTTPGQPLPPQHSPSAFNQNSDASTTTTSVNSKTTNGEKSFPSSSSHNYRGNTGHDNAQSSVLNKESITLVKDGPPAHLPDSGNTTRLGVRNYRDSRDTPAFSGPNTGDAQHLNGPDTLAVWEEISSFSRDTGWSNAGQKQRYLERGRSNRWSGRRDNDSYNLTGGERGSKNNNTNRPPNNGDASIFSPALLKAEEGNAETCNPGQGYASGTATTFTTISSTDVYPPYNTGHHQQADTLPVAPRYDNKQFYYDDGQNPGRSADAANISAPLTTTSSSLAAPPPSPPPRPPERNAKVTRSRERQKQQQYPTTQHLQQHTPVSTALCTSTPQISNFENEGRQGHVPLLNAEDYDASTSVSTKSRVNDFGNRYEDKDSIPSVICDSDKPSATSVSEGVTVKQAFSFWNTNSTTDRLDSKSNSQPSQRDSADDNVKRAVFQRDGDSVRLFIVPDNRPVVSQQKHFHNHSSHGIKREQSDNQILTDFSVSKEENDVSKSSKPTLKRSDSITRKFSRLLGGGKKDQTKGKSPPGLVRKPINRWDNIHVRTGVGADLPSPPCHSEQTVQTERAQLEPSPGHARDDAANQTTDPTQNVPEPYFGNNVDGEPTGERIYSAASESETFHNGKPTLKGILVHKDGHTKENYGRVSNPPGHKANSVQFVDDTLLRYQLHNLNHSPAEACNNNNVFPQPGTRREVIDRSKYIIKPRETSENLLNRSLDSVLSETPVTGPYVVVDRSDGSTSNSRTVCVQDVDSYLQASDHRFNGCVDTAWQGTHRIPSITSATDPRTNQQLSSLNDVQTDNFSTRPPVLSNGLSSPLQLGRGSLEQNEQGGPRTHFTSSSQQQHDQQREEDVSNHRRAPGVFLPSHSSYQPGLSEEIRPSGGGDFNSRDPRNVLAGVQANDSSTVTSGHSTDRFDQPLQQGDRGISSSGIPRPDSLKFVDSRSSPASDCEESRSYRQNLRDLCKKGHLLNSPGGNEDLNHPRISGLSKGDTHQSSPYSPEAFRGDLSGRENNPRLKPAPKITPRQKFEIRHSRVSEKVAANLRHNPNELAPRPDISRADENIENILDPRAAPRGLPEALFGVHKESPRAKFERDRAARSNAVCVGAHHSSSVLVTSDRLNKSCDELDTSSAFSQPQFKCDNTLPVREQSLSDKGRSQEGPTFAAILSPKACLNNQGVHDNIVSESRPSNERRDYDKRFNPLAKSTWINKGFSSDHDTDWYPGQHDCAKPRVVDLVPCSNEHTHSGAAAVVQDTAPVHWTRNQRADSERESGTGNKATPSLVPVPIQAPVNNIDTNVNLSSGRTGVQASFARDLTRASLPLSGREQIQRNLLANDHRGFIETNHSANKENLQDHLQDREFFSSSSKRFDLQDEEESQNAPALPPRKAGQGLRPRGQPGGPSDKHKLRLAVKKMSPDSVSSSGYESEHNNANVLNHTGKHVNLGLPNKRVFVEHLNNKKNNIIEANSNFEQLRLQFGHQSQPLTCQAKPVYSKDSISISVQNSGSTSNYIYLEDKIVKNSDVNNNKNVSVRSPTSPECYRKRRLSSSESKPSNFSSNSEEGNKNGITKVHKSKHGISSDFQGDNCGRPSCKRALKNYPCSKCAKKSNRRSPFNSEDSSRNNSLDTNSDRGRHLSPPLSEDRGVKYNSLNSCEDPRYFSLDDSVMLASKGLRIYESSGGDYIAMKSPVKSPLQKAVSAPQVRWENTSYLIMPTVVGSLSPPGTLRRDDGNPANSMSPRPNDFMAHRSISDSGASGQRHRSSLTGDTSVSLPGNRQSDPIADCSEAYLSMGSTRRNKSNLNSRAMSVDVLYAESPVSPQTLSLNSDNTATHWHPGTKIHRRRDGSRTNPRGYVEWRTCSGWVGNTDMRKADGRNSRGYVEWDTIWTTAAPWNKDPNDDEHVYDVIAEDNSSHSFEDGHHSLELPRRSRGFSHRDQAAAMSVPIDTPPALPERTYINRLKNNRSDRQTSPHSSSSTCSKHSGHVNVPGGKRHHHHHHHQHQHNHPHHNHHHHLHHHHQQQQHHDSTQPPPHTCTNNNNSINDNNNSIKDAISKEKQNLTLPPFPKHESSSLTTSPQSPESPSPKLRLNDSSLGSSENYAQVSKLKGYKYTNLMNSFPDTTDTKVNSESESIKLGAVSAENYWHLGPVSSTERVTNWQTGDVLDYIDGLHDSMSPKRRENIYMLLTHKKTRAKFSESLEIESRLLSKGLLPSSHDDSCSDGSRKDDLSPSVEVKDFPPAVPAHKKKKPKAPVSSTYV